MNRHQILPIWDLCHYGYPDDLDPFEPDFGERFAAYARAAAEYVVPRVQGPHFFTPINEITFFGFMGGEWGWAAPFGTPKRTGTRFASPCAPPTSRPSRRFASRSRARMVHIDPLVLVVPPKDRPDLADEAAHETLEDTFYAWDVIAGQRHPELGGAEILDIVGVNCYSFGQMEFREQGPHAALPPDDPRIKPLGELLTRVWERYRRPMIVGETVSARVARIGSGTSSRNRWPPCGGIDLHGVCLFPAVDMPNWHSGEWLHNGICDLVEEGGDLRRACVRTLRRRAPLAARGQPRHRARRGPVQRPGEPGRHRRGSEAAAAGVG